MVKHQVTKKIESWIHPTFFHTVRRITTGMSPGKWIDMKINPQTGASTWNSDQHSPYARRNIFSWIQGRGLEALTGYCKWMNTRPENHTGTSLSSEEVISACEALYNNLFSLIKTTNFPKPGSGHFPFLFHEDSPQAGALSITAFPQNDALPDFPTLSDLFVIRGLVAYADFREKKDDLIFLTSACRNILSYTSRGKCINDQISFDPDNPGGHIPGRFGYEGLMLTIGASEILGKATGNLNDYLYGMSSIQATLQSHTRFDSGYGFMLVDFLTTEGNPYFQNSMLLNDPGHALEFAGISLQFLQHLPKELSNMYKDVIENELIPKLTSLALLYDTLGKANHGGIYKTINSKTGTPVYCNSFWWASFESIRTFTQLLNINHIPSEKQDLSDRLMTHIHAAETLFMGQSAIGIPVQAVDPSGHIIAVIPATPDIDPGYHTGLPLISALEILS